MTGFSVTNVSANLPEYVVEDPIKCIHHDILTMPAQDLTFPLSESDKNDIAILEAKFDAEINCAGLAAPQIGIAKKIIVLALPDDPDLKKWRPDLVQSLPKTILINPTYEPIGSAQREDYEGCFSVQDVAGKVKRYTSIYYRGYTLEGKLVEDTAEGFLARILQHEIDHIHGKLFIDYVAPEKLFNMEEYRRLKAAAIQENS